jgi:hypothetical protein
MGMRSILILVIAALLAGMAFGQPALSSRTASIASSGSLSGAVNIGDEPIIAIIMPSAWTSANLTLQASIDGATYYSVYNMDGDEYTITASASRYIVFSPHEFQWARYVKLRSGTADTPVSQDAARSITIITRRIP